MDALRAVYDVVRRLHGAHDRVLDGEHRAVDVAARERTGNVAKITAWHRLDVAAPELLDGLFTERTKLALEGDA
jgi:hypothetical protein